MLQCNFTVWFVQGDGTAISQCQWTYSGHRKTVLAITFLDSLRLAASCDSVVHLWDPFMGCVVAQLDSARNPPITVLRSMPPPSTSIMAATNDATLRLLDARTCSYVNELKVINVCNVCRTHAGNSVRHAQTPQSPKAFQNCNSFTTEF